MLAYSTSAQPMQWRGQREGEGEREATDFSSSSGREKVSAAGTTTMAELVWIAMAWNEEEEETREF